MEVGEENPHNWQYVESHGYVGNFLLNIRQLGKSMDLYTWSNKSNLTCEASEHLMSSWIGVKHLESVS